LKAYYFLAEKPASGENEDMDNFTPWLSQELKNRSWRPADLAHRAGLCTGTLSNIMNGNRGVGPDMCKAIAQALGEPPEKLFRLAGLLPPLSAAEDEQLYELLETFQRLTPEKRQEVLDYARWQLQRQQNGAKSLLAEKPKM
jgi:transcriptional regulator with XRE-family HTH domain